jgi:hypothetical protein
MPLLHRHLPLVSFVTPNSRPTGGAVDQRGNLFHLPIMLGLLGLSNGFACSFRCCIKPNCTQGEMRQKQPGRNGKTLRLDPVTEVKFCNSRPAPLPDDI